MKYLLYFKYSLLIISMILIGCTNFVSNDGGSIRGKVYTGANSAAFSIKPENNADEFTNQSRVYIGVMSKSDFDDIVSAVTPVAQEKIYFSSGGTNRISTSVLLTYTYTEYPGEYRIDFVPSGEIVILAWYDAYQTGNSTGVLDGGEYFGIYDGDSAGNVITGGLEYIWFNMNNNILENIDIAVDAVNNS